MDVSFTVREPGGICNVQPRERLYWYSVYRRHFTKSIRHLLNLIPPNRPHRRRPCLRPPPRHQL